MILEFPPRPFHVAGYMPHLPTTPKPQGLGAEVPDRTYKPGHGFRMARHDAYVSVDERLAAWERKQGTG